MECIVSMFLLMLLGTIIGISFQSVYRFLEINKTNIEIVNIAQEYINDKKYSIKNSSTEVIEFYEETQIDKYEIKSKLTKLENYNQCYELNLIVSYSGKSIEVDTYVTKE